MGDVPSVLVVGGAADVAAVAAFARGLCGPVSAVVSDPADVARDALAAAVAGSARAQGADAVLMAQGLLAEDLAPRVAGLLGAPCAPACTALAWEGDRWALTRGLHGGALVGSFECAGPLVASLDVQGAGLAVAACVPEGIDATVLEAAAPGDGTRVLGLELDLGDDVPLEAAERIVAGGRGIGGPEGFAVLGLLAAALGAGLGSSRPPCDAGWVPSTRQVGITGRKVAPQVYVAVGISGSVQHLAGMAGSRLVVAVNSDREAPIFRYAHLGAVGDWEDVVAGMLDALDSRPVTAGEVVS